MPMYEYYCATCGKKFEILRRMQDAEANCECPECHSQNAERLFSAFSTGGCAGGARFT